MFETSIPDVLRERAYLQPTDPAFTFIDYDQDWAGVAESLTWSQIYRRTLNVANELSRYASTGDRAVILAPQGLEYVAGFLGALHAGLIAVPLSAPMGGAHDERVHAVLHDTSPSVILTTSSVVGDVARYTQARNGDSSPSVIEVDSLDLDSGAASDRDDSRPDIAYLQYTSGSTRRPAGVMISYENVLTNFQQCMQDFFADGGTDITVVSWLPFYHDMGLLAGICKPIFGGFHSVLMSPLAFLQRPGRWMQLMASNRRAVTAGPNFALELAVRKTIDEDMAGLDLSGVLAIISGSERIHAATVRRFLERFAKYNLDPTVFRPSYGLAEATLYVATNALGRPPNIARFESEALSAGTAKRCASGGTPLVSYHVRHSPMVRIVDPDTRTERPAGTTGEIWVHGDNVAKGYWRKPEESKQTFRAKLVNPSTGTPGEPWLRTGDLGFFSDGELFIMGRIKDLLIVYGRNHSPDDIEATIQEITRGRCAAIAVPDRETEKLVAIIEFRHNGDSPEVASNKLVAVKREVASAVSNSHGLGVADLVVVAPGSIPITTSGKVRRAACVERYRQNQFARLDA
ncbi:acyl-CoA synthetase [Mycobacterium sp. 852002-51163_SCH5372311]|uniref:AMP-binding protein n=1 Tax=Mycobacterium sp. 852002-51163_SCH5372311 TaxID=1834097 RepID=UPI0007FBAC58|nr:AMP-binding protein [Mycobacterium sp. 852002-51163_SCH5372311]OBF79732.1 acyl-CoA synthetase [Mycobacterium sp. 852002-51163_SCH5372311]